MIFRVYVDRTSASYPENYVWELTQDVTALPEGIYTVTAQAMADNIEGEVKFYMSANGVDMAEGIHTESTGAFTCDKGSAIDVLRDEALNKCLVKAENVEVKADGLLHIRMAKPLVTADGKQNFFFDNFCLMYHGPKDQSAIESVAADNIEADTLVDVYNVSGMNVRMNVPFSNALDTLPKGIYLVRAGEKVMKIAK